MDKRQLLRQLTEDEEERILLSHLLDLLQRSRDRGIPAESGFLRPGEQQLALQLLQRQGVRDGFAFWGGYPQAERKKLLFLPDWAADAPEDYASIACLQGEFFQEESLSHRDVLGSLMGLGVARDTVGDLLLTPGRVQVCVEESVAPFLLQSWESAGRVKLRVHSIEANQLQPPQPQLQQRRDTVASLRLDAVAAVGFSISRSKAAQLIESGRLLLNDRECCKSDAPVKQGDIFSIRGLGKCCLAEVGGQSKKGRTGVVVHRYV